MRSSWTEPYLWVHLAGIAAVPVFLELCLVGLAASQRVVPTGIGFLLVALVGISPILWMQWYRPFSIFSLVALALKPSELTETQRRILGQFKTPVAKVVAVVVAILAFLILRQLNQWLPYAPILSVPGGWLAGLVLAAGAFLLSNLFLQVPASVLMVLLTPESQMAAMQPYPTAQIPADFTLIGLQVKQILPPIVLATAPATSPVASPAASSVTSPSTPTDAPIAEVVQPQIPEISQPEIIEEISQSEISQPEIIEEISQSEISQPEIIENISPSEITEPESIEFAEPQIFEAKRPDLIEQSTHFESGQAEAASEPPSTIAEAGHPTDASIPQAADTVVMVVPSSVEAVSSTSNLTQELKTNTEPPKAEPSASTPTASDTIVTIGLPTAEPDA